MLIELFLMRLYTSITELRLMLNTRGNSRCTLMSFPSPFIQKDASDSSVLMKMKQVGVMERMESGPVLEDNKLAMCLSEETTDITALSPALYSPPLHFELTGDIQGKWRLQFDYGNRNKSSFQHCISKQMYLLFHCNTIFCFVCFFSQVHL